MGPGLVLQALKAAPRRASPAPVPFGGASRWLWRLGAAVLCVGTGGTVGLAVAYLGPLASVALVAALCAAIWFAADASVALAMLVAVICLLPFGVVPVRLGVAPTFLDVATAGLIGLWLIRWWTRQDGAPRPTPVNRPLVLYCALMSAGFVAGTAAGITGEQARYFVKLLAAVLLFFAVVNLVRDWPRLRFVVRALILLGALEGAIGVALYAAGEQRMVQVLRLLGPLGYPRAENDIVRYIADTTRIRATATSIDPNVLGGLLLVTGSLALVQLFVRRPVLPRLVLAAATAAILPCLLLTFSRGAWVGLAAALLYVATLRYRRAWLVLLAAAGAALLVPQAELFVERFLAGVRLQDRATIMRLTEYQNAWDIIRRYPVLGIGFGAAPELELYRGVSNLYLMIAEQSGLLGLSAFLIAAARLLLPAIQLAQQPLELPEHGVLLSLTAALAGGLSGGMFDHYFTTFPHMAALLWLCAGLTVSACLLLHPPAPDETARTARTGS
jgi:O-antigen ligase